MVRSAQAIRWTKAAFAEDVHNFQNPDGSGRLLPAGVRGTPSSSRPRNFAWGESTMDRGVACFSVRPPALPKRAPVAAAAAEVDALALYQEDEEDEAAVVLAELESVASEASPYARGGTWAAPRAEDVDDAPPPPPPPHGPAGLTEHEPLTEGALQRLELERPVERRRPKRLENKRATRRERAAPPPPPVRRFLVINNSGVNGNAPVTRKFAKSAERKDAAVRSQRRALAASAKPRPKVTRHFHRPSESPIYQNQRYPSHSLRYGTEAGDEFGWPKATANHAAWR